MKPGPNDSKTRSSFHYIMLLVQSIPTPPVSPRPMQYLRITAFTLLYSPPSPARAYKWENPGLSLLNLPNNKSLFLDSENKQSIESLDILVPWPQQGFLAGFFTAPLSRANIFCLSAFAHIFLSEGRDLTHI